MKESILQKQNEVNALAEKMKNSAAIVVFKYQGLTVEAFQALRREMRSNGGEIAVIKNNISIAVAFSSDDVVAPAKVLFAATKGENAKVEVVKGVIDGDVYSFDQLKTLSQLPSYETLLTQLAVGMLGTVSQLAIGLNMLVEQGQQA